MLIPLKILIENLKDSDGLLERFLCSFSCTDDEDIESFLHNRAVEFEKLSKSRTYLICDEEQMERDSLEQVTIYGYISVALKILAIPDELSNRVRKELDGFSAKIHGEPIHDIPCYLIGQLSRNSNVPKELLSGTELIGYACDVIAGAVNSVGGRYMMIECRDREKLIRFYQQNLFREIARIPDGNVPMVQMIRKIEYRDVFGLSIWG